MFWSFHLSYGVGFELIIYNLCHVEGLLYLFQDFNPNVYGACMNMYMQVWISMCVHLEATVPCQAHSFSFSSLVFFLLLFSQSHSQWRVVNDWLARPQVLPFSVSHFWDNRCIPATTTKSLLGCWESNQVLRFAQHTLSHLLSLLMLDFIEWHFISIEKTAIFIRCFAAFCYSYWFAYV